jgi:hypothetical protein
MYKVFRWRGMGFLKMLQYVMLLSPRFTACWGQKLILAPSARYLALIPAVWVWAISKRKLRHRLSVGEAFLTFQL